ncbi:PadR family transcriptional regulator [Candidatus Chlorohelix sp.]|uniref:PadR family transcriptional regulator n=1 Tax=Candidatus Chlorohelix sp. TaxID=3139201 RepID=UPI00305DA585
MAISEKIWMPTEYAVLGLLMDGSKHGYELARRFAPETALGTICHLEMSMLYANLKKLQKMDYIEAEMEIQGNRPPKRVFNLTGTGRAAFIEWVRSPVARLREIQPDFLIKLYFARQLGTDDVGALIGRQIELCRQALERLRQGHTLNEEVENLLDIRAGNYSGLNLGEEEDFSPKGKRSHPKPSEHELARDPTPEEQEYVELVTTLRIRQNEAVIEWLNEARRKLASGY